MNKSIKYIIEQTINFNPVDYTDNDTVDNQTIQNIVYYRPKNIFELYQVLDKKFKENKFGNKDLIFPDLSDIDTSNVTDMSNLFGAVMSKITTHIKLDLSTWDTSNVTNMLGMFNDCQSL